MYPLLMLLAAPMAPTVTIEVDCGGGILPSRHRAVLNSDGRVSTMRLGYRPGNATGQVDPEAVQKLSARLDVAGFDRLQSPKPHFQVYDGVTCSIGRRTAKGYHRITLLPGVDVSSRGSRDIAAVNAVIVDAFALADTVAAKPAPSPPDASQ